MIKEACIKMIRKYKAKDKELLLKDLCARLPYQPIVQIDGCGMWNLRGVDHDDSSELRDRVIVWYGENYPSSKNSFPIINCKPYLFPLSSMTEEQQINLTKFVANGINGQNILYDWYNKNHFDYRGLIEKGLAIDATGLNVY